MLMAMNLSLKQNTDVPSLFNCCVLGAMQVVVVSRVKELIIGSGKRNGKVVSTSGPEGGKISAFLHKPLVLSCCAEGGKKKRSFYTERKNGVILT